MRVPQPRRWPPVNIPDNSTCGGSFAPAAGPAGELARLDAGDRARVASAAADARAPATRRAYAAQQHAGQPGAAPRQARALTCDQARELMLAARDRRRRGRGLESEVTAARRARVDDAIVGLLFCGGLRRAAAAALVWADGEPTERLVALRPAGARGRAGAAGRVDDGGADGRRLAVTADGRPLRIGRRRRGRPRGPAVRRQPAGNTTPRCAGLTRGRHP